MVYFIRGWVDSTAGLDDLEVRNKNREWNDESSVIDP
jgi:hypothetical protein